MVTKDQVIETHRVNPNWGAVQIAKHLGCLPAYVRATAKRNGLVLPRGTRSRPGENATTVERERCAGIAERMGAPRIAKAIRDPLYG